jgi:predicted kinase
MLIGLPACGKSTWRAANVTDQHVYSTDDLVEELARNAGKTYDDMWSDHIRAVTKSANKQLSDAIRAKKSVVSDRTNLVPEGRIKFLYQFPRTYKRHAIIFELPVGPDQTMAWAHRLTSREGKTIDASIIERMLAQYKEPTLAEGFDSIEYYNSWK